MTDPRLKTLAEKLVNYSCRVQKGENCLIEATDCDTALVEELVAQVRQAGGHPYVWMRSSLVKRALLMEASDEELLLQAENDAALMAQMDAYIGIRAAGNQFELSDVPVDKIEKCNTLYWEKVHAVLRVEQTKWVILRYPDFSMAQAAKCSTRAYEDFFFQVCNLDYQKMSRAMDALVGLMDRTDKVRLLAPGTDLTFSIKNIPAVKCDGLCNIPDGEVYTAPVKDSINGTITYNTPSLEDGFVFERIAFTFKNGKIVEATANDTARLNAILDTDEGARYVGEFSLGVNPYITKAQLDTLFDEKIAGSIHLTPGSCYEDAPNGNKSAVHWDLVLVMTPAYGGGEIWFDDVLIRKDGRFVLPELAGLNPEKLM